MSSTHADGVNPLRPYYIPPTIGEAPDVRPSGGGPSLNRGNATAGSGYASKARDMFQDLDYNYLNETQPSMVQSVKELLDELLWKYTSVLMAQPFEVAKIILQTRDQDNVALASPRTPDPSIKRTTSYGSSVYDLPDSDSDADEPAYFTSNAPNTPAGTPSVLRRQGSRRSASPSKASFPPGSSAKPNTDNQLNIRNPDSVLDVINQVWQKEGAWGVWKGSNATFLYTVLQSLLENWSRSFLSAIFNVPDLGVKDDIDRLIDIASPYPWVSLFVAAAAAVATGVVLAPLDLVRTRLIMTPSTKGQRRTLTTLRALPSYICSPLLFVPTVLHSLVHPLLTLSTPLVLRTRFMIDSQISPMTFSVAKFFASSAAILIKLPLETVLRRGQMAVLSSQEFVRALGSKDPVLETVVPVGKYMGVLGTMYHISSEEGTRTTIAKSSAAKRGKAKAKTPMLPVVKKGQGVGGLMRGWKVNWWGLVGLWTASVVGNGGEGEF